MAVLDQNWVGWTRREFLAKVEMYELELWVESVSLSLIWNSMQQRSATARRPAGLSKDLFEPSSTLTSSWTFLLHTYVRTIIRFTYVFQLLCTYSYIRMSLFKNFSWESSYPARHMATNRLSPILQSWSRWSEMYALFVRTYVRISKGPRILCVLSFGSGLL